MGFPPKEKITPLSFCESPGEGKAGASQLHLNPLRTSQAGKEVVFCKAVTYKCLSSL